MGTFISWASVGNNIYGLFIRLVRCKWAGVWPSSLLHVYGPTSKQDINNLNRCEIINRQS